MDHEIPVRIVDNQEYMKVVRSILEEGKEVPLVVTGNSMMPFLIDRRDQVLIKRIYCFFSERKRTVYYAQNSLYAKR